METVRLGLQRWVVGRRIRDVEVFGARTLRRYPPGAAGFVARLTGRRIVGGTGRRGKYLWLSLDDGTQLLAHLGMSGQLLAVVADTANGPHLRARFRFDDAGPELRFVDQRTFGSLSLADDEVSDDGVPRVLGHVAPDPFEAAFDEVGWSAAVRRRRTGVKRALLDQTLMSGVGNIYADEALWRARLHYARATDRLRHRGGLDRLLDAVRAVMGEAIDAGGTSFDGLYVAVNGQSGWFEREARPVYGREEGRAVRAGVPRRSSGPSS